MDFFEEMEARIPKGEVRTRFAPSPTGYMHVGNLRTALYTWLIARRYGGKFILRIEDTDQGRLIEGATDVIYRTMAECGLTHDEGPDVGGPVGPYIQSQRRDLFGKYAKRAARTTASARNRTRSLPKKKPARRSKSTSAPAATCRLQKRRQELLPVSRSSSASASRRKARPRSTTCPSATLRSKTRSWRIRFC